MSRIDFAESARLSAERSISSKVALIELSRSSVSWLVGMGLSGIVVVLDDMVVLPRELDHSQSLGNLSKLKLVLMSIPKTFTTCILGVVTDSVSVESTVVVGDLILKFLEIKRRFLVIDAS